MAKKMKPGRIESSRGTKVTALVVGEVMKVTEKAVLVQAYGGSEPLWLPKSQLESEPPKQGGWIDRARVPRWLARDKELTIEEVVAETSTGLEVRPRIVCWDNLWQVLSTGVDGSAGNSWGFVGLLDQLPERRYVHVFELLDVET